MIVFLSNFLNHHQLPFCKKMVRLTDEQFIFIATEQIHQERLNMGYADMNHLHDFVLCAYDSADERKKAIELCLSCDVLITGSAPDYYFKQRLKQKKLTFKYGERFFKTPFTLGNVFQRTASMLRHMIPYQNDNYYLLCASAYMPNDCKLYHCFTDRIYKWGYFPEVKRYDDIDGIIAAKRPASILWAARLIGWKHPDDSILVAMKLKEAGYRFELNIIGNGELDELLRQMITENDLHDCIKMLGAMKPEQVREHMEQSEIFLFTSDRNEGWGAVLNESMNSGCAVVASQAIGSVPFLIKDRENGLIYKDGDIDDLFEKVKWLLEHSSERPTIGKKAYETMNVMWSPEVVAERFMNLMAQLQSSGSCNLYQDGPCSRAGSLKEKRR